MLVDSAGLALAGSTKLLGDANDEGNAGTGIIEPALGPGQADPVVRPVNDDGVLIFSGLLECGDVVADPRIHGGDELVVSLPVLPNTRRVGVVGREGFQFGGILAFAGRKSFGHGLVFCIAGDAALVAAGEVEDGKEGLVFVAVVGGIYGGIFTPTEGAAVGALGTGLIAYFNGGLTRTSLVESFTVTARSTAMIFLIVLGAGFYNGFLALTQVPQEIAEWVVGMGFNPWMVLVLILVFYLLLGCLMDSLSMILLTIPIFFPVITALDFNFTSLAELQAMKAMAVINSGAIPEAVTGDMLANIKTAIANGAELTRDQMRALDIRMSKGMARRIESEQVAIWFGILVLIVVEVGLITPPVGMNLFIINAMDRKTPMIETYKAVILFVASDLVRVALLVAFPAITLFLVQW